MTPLVTVEWLKDHLENEDLVLLDASPIKTIEGTQTEFDNQTIPDARVFDLKGQFSDANSPFPNTMPTEKQFETNCRKLGIKKSSRIVVFDNLGIYTSPRVWWMFKIMGHEQVSVLDGGLPEWIEKGFQTTEIAPKSYSSGDFMADFQMEFVKTYEDVLNNVKHHHFTIVDARSEGRFRGTEKEPRVHLQSGHIPGSVNIPYQSVLADGSARYKPMKELKRLFEEICGNEQNLVFSCGSGLTACIVLLASELAFKESRFVYDGSWTEWAEKENLTTSIEGS